MSAIAKDIEAARQWLKKQREDMNGPMATWSGDTWDRFHRDFGLLIDFLTDPQAKTDPKQDILCPPQTQTPP